MYPDLQEVHGKKEKMIWMLCARTERKNKESFLFKPHLIPNSVQGEMESVLL